MGLDDIRPTVIQKINDMEDLFQLDLDSRVKIARHFRWNSEAMETQWFEKKAKLELELGIVFDPKLVYQYPNLNYSLMKNNGGVCLICYEALNDANKFCLSCGHTFCLNDWREYLIKKVEEGSSGLDAKCMQAGCNLKVGHSVFEKLLPSSKVETYWKWLCKSYTDDNKRIKWCPSQGCEMCYEKSIYSMITEVRCDCGGSLCF